MQRIVESHFPSIKHDLLKAAMDVFFDLRKVPGGSVEHWNEEPGALWLKRLQLAFPHCVWLNPESPEWWHSTPSVRMTQELMQERMYPLSVDGLQKAIDALKIPMSGMSLTDQRP